MNKNYTLINSLGLNSISKRLYVAGLILAQLVYFNCAAQSKIILTTYKCHKSADSKWVYELIKWCHRVDSAYDKVIDYFDYKNQGDYFALQYAQGWRPENGPAYIEYPPEEIKVHNGTYSAFNRIKLDLNFEIKAEKIPNRFSGFLKDKIIEAMALDTNYQISNLLWDIPENDPFYKYTLLVKTDVMPHPANSDSPDDTSGYPSLEKFALRCSARLINNENHDTADLRTFTLKVDPDNLPNSIKNYFWASNATYASNRPDYGLSKNFEEYYGLDEYQKYLQDFVNKQLHIPRYNHFSIQFLTAEDGKNSILAFLRNLNPVARTEANPEAEDANIYTVYTACSFNYLMELLRKFPLNFKYRIEGKNGMIAVYERR